MMTARLKAVTVNRHPDSMMTPAQIARRKFKSGLARKIENRRLSAMEAIGATFTLLDQFRGLVTEEKQDPETVYAAIAYSLPESDPATLVHTITVPGPSKIGKFCEKVIALDRPLFLGVVFVQVDPDTDNRAYKAVSFVAQFMGGPEAEGRLLVAQKRELLKIQKTLEGLGN
jgi:hypothetical protein